MHSPLFMLRYIAFAALLSLNPITAFGQSMEIQPRQESVALLPIEGQRLDPMLVKICSELLTDHLGDISERKLITSSDIQAMLSLEEQKMSLNCEDQTSCIAEIGGALGVDELVRASLSRLGSKLIISMTRIHVQSATVLKRATIKIENDEDLYDDALKSAVVKLYGSAPRKTAERPRTSRQEDVIETMNREVTDGGPNLFEWTVMSMGAGTIAAGLVFGSFARSKEKQSNDIGGQVKLEEARELAQIANILYGLGGVGVTAGLSLWYFGDEEADIALVPVVTTDGAYVSLSGSLPW